LRVKSGHPQGPETRRLSGEDSRPRSGRAPSRSERKVARNLGLSAPVTSMENVWEGTDWSGRRDSNLRPQPWQGFGSAATNSAASSAMVPLTSYSPRPPSRPLGPPGPAVLIGVGSVPAFHRSSVPPSRPPPPLPASAPSSTFAAGNARTAWNAGCLTERRWYLRRCRGRARAPPRPGEPASARGSLHWPGHDRFQPRTFFSPASTGHGSAAGRGWPQGAQHLRPVPVGVPLLARRPALDLPAPARRQSEVLRQAEVLE